jgi:hypothetical protein
MKNAPGRQNEKVRLPRAGKNPQAPGAPGEVGSCKDSARRWRTHENAHQRNGAAANADRRSGRPQQLERPLSPHRTERDSRPVLACDHLSGGLERSA